ncbi:MAG TPA: acyltransferase family protein, partial [Steroidobacteraceae bacterium]
MNAPNEQRLHALDAVRGFALLLGVAFHAALSFMPGWPPGIWAMNDNSPSPLLSDAAFVSHLFRMTLFFFIAGFFARLMHQKRGTGGFWKNRLMRIGLPLVLGWAVLYPLISAVWVAGLTKTFGGNLPPMPEMPKTFGAFPMTHLWFLYQLLQLYVITLAVRALIVRLDRSGKLRGAVDTILSGALRYPVAAFWLGIPVAFALMNVPVWFYWSGIPTPDQTLLPQAAPVVGYGVAFAFGWLVHRSRDALASIARYWLVYLVVGGAAAAALLASLHVSAMAPMGPPDAFDLLDGGVLTRSGFAFVFGIASWGLALGITGAALRFLSGYSPARRYVADASYWIYLAHLPVVAALQVWVGHWQLHWGIKFPFILVTSFALLFASYHWLVRPTVIGQLLNGRKYRRGMAPDSPPATPAPQSPGPLSPGPRGGGVDGAVAELRGITKKFGSVTALNGIDVQLRSGELLAVLGPNGAGKSTAISLWLGLHEADAGEVFLLGGSPLEIAHRQGLGVMMQDVELPKELTPREHVRLASSYYADPLPLEETLRR